MFTNVLDLYRWDLNSYHNVLDGGGQELIEMVRTPGLFNDGKSSDYGFGLRADTAASRPWDMADLVWFQGDLVQFLNEVFCHLLTTWRR